MPPRRRHETCRPHHPGPRHRLLQAVVQDVDHGEHEDAPDTKLEPPRHPPCFHYNNVDHEAEQAEQDGDAARKKPSATRSTPSPSRRARHRPRRQARAVAVQPEPRSRVRSITPSSSTWTPLLRATSPPLGDCPKSSWPLRPCNDPGRCTFDLMSNLHTTRSTSAGLRVICSVNRPTIESLLCPCSTQTCARRHQGRILATPCCGTVLLLPSRRAVSSLMPGQPTTILDAWPHCLGFRRQPLLDT